MKLWRIVAIGCVPIASSRIFKTSPGFAVISVGANFMSSPAEMMTVRAGAAGTLDAAPAGDLD